MAEELAAFIKEQKAKLAQERQETGPANSNERHEERRRRWDKQGCSPLRVESDSGKSNSDSEESESFLDKLGEYASTREKYIQQRHQDCIDYFRENAPVVGRRPETPEETGLPLGTYEQHQKMLQEQRRQEYNSLPGLKNFPKVTSVNTEHLGLPLRDNEEKRRKLQDERKQEYNSLIAQQTPSPPQKGHLGIPSDGGNLPLGESEENRRRLAEERSRDMQQHLKKQIAPVVDRTPEPRSQSQPPYFGQYEERRNRLNEERRQEYNQIVKKNTPVSSRTPIPQPESPVLTFGDHVEYTSTRLNEERRRDYNKVKHHNSEMPSNGFKENVPPGAGTSRRQAAQPSEGGLFGNLGAESAEKKKKLAEERHKEYNEKIAETKVRTTGVVDSGSRGYVSTLPVYKEQPQASSPQEVSLPGLRDRHSAEVMKMKERNREYNDIIDEHEGRRRGSDRRDRDYDVLDDDDSFRPGDRQGRRRRPMRKESYSDEDDDDFRRQFRSQPRKGWGTPTHEEFLEQKRQAERAYRRNDDIRPSARDLDYDYPSRDRWQDYERDRDRDRDRGVLGGRNYSRNSISDGDLARHLVGQEERRYRDLEEKYERKKLSILNRDTDPFLTPAMLKSKFGHDNINQSNERDSEVGRGQGRSRYTPRSPSPPPRVTPRQSMPTQGQQNGYSSGLMIGTEVRASADQRKKAAYREELEKQMNEAKATKQREKAADRAMPGGGGGPTGLEYSQPARQQNPSSQQRPPQQPPYQSSTRQPLQRQAPSVLDEDFSPRAILFQGDHRGGGAPRHDSILEAGWGTSLYRPSVGGPQGNLLGRQVPNMMPQQFDDPYGYYGKVNPMDVADMGYTTSPDQRGFGQTSFRAEPPASTHPKSVSIAPPPNRAPQQQTNIQNDGFQFSQEVANPCLDKKRAYQEELKRQIQADKDKKAELKKKQEAEDRRKEEEIRVYDPFGRGGAGAPLKDKFGNTIASRKPPPGEVDHQSPAEADRKMMRKENEERSLLTPREVMTTHYSTVPHVTATDSPATEDGANFARGGHGIFGEGKTEAVKSKEQRYKEELRRQMEEKQKEKDLLKQKEKEEELKMARKLEEDQKRIQDELESEKRKEREKIEEAQRQQAELQRQRDEQRKEEERKRKEAEEKKQEEARIRLDEQLKQREQQAVASTAHAAANNSRSRSPPVPAVKHKLQQRPSSPPVPALANRKKGSVDAAANPYTMIRNQTVVLARQPPPSLPPGDDHHHSQTGQQQEDVRSDSPAVPALKNKAVQQQNTPPTPDSRSQAGSRASRQGSADILKQLSRMKAQLKQERQRVEGDLASEGPEPSVYDSRLVPPAEFPSSSRTEKARRRDKDVFETAQHKQPVSVRRNLDSAQLRDFTNFKHRNDSAMGQALRSLYPDDPQTSDALETQQRAMLRQQEEQLRNLRAKKSQFEDVQPGELGYQPASHSPMLDADTAFVSVPNNGRLPDDLEDLEGTRNDSAREKRRNREQMKNPAIKPQFESDRESMGSVLSLDPDKIARKNEERMRKLKMVDDNISLADPDDILDRFMAKQVHNRPRSGDTLVDDTWLRAEGYANF